MTVSGLKSKPEANGRGGTVEDFVAAKGRFAVRIDGLGDNAMLLKPENVTRADGGVV